MAKERKNPSQIQAGHKKTVPEVFIRSGTPRPSCLIGKLLGVAKPNKKTWLGKRTFFVP